jgi:hypothetical protein
LHDSSLGLANESREFCAMRKDLIDQKAIIRQPERKANRSLRKIWRAVLFELNDAAIFDL